MDVLICCYLNLVRCFIQVAGVSPSMVTRLLNEGHGSDELKKHISDKLGIREPWELFGEN